MSLQAEVDVFLLPTSSPIEGQADSNRSAQTTIFRMSSFTRIIYLLDLIQKAEQQIKDFLRWTMIYNMSLGRRGCCMIRCLHHVLSVNFKGTYTSTATSRQISAMRASLTSANPIVSTFRELKDILLHQQPNWPSSTKLGSIARCLSTQQAMRHHGNGITRRCSCTLNLRNGVFWTLFRSLTSRDVEYQWKTRTHSWPRQHSCESLRRPKHPGPWRRCCMHSYATACNTLQV